MAHTVAVETGVEMEVDMGVELGVERVPCFHVAALPCPRATRAQGHMMAHMTTRDLAIM